MSLDRETAETIAPVVTMIGQQSRLDASWACHMIEAVAGQALPEFYRENRRVAASEGERIRYDLKLALISGARTDDIVRLAHVNANAERLDEALYWIGKALDSLPGEGELLRFKASILERMRRFGDALVIAREAELRGADAAAIRDDIERMQSQWILHLRQASRSANLAASLRSYATLLEQGRVRATDIPKILFRTLRLFALGRTERNHAKRRAA